MASVARHAQELLGRGGALGEQAQAVVAQAVGAVGAGVGAQPGFVGAGVDEALDGVVGGDELVDAGAAGVAGAAAGGAAGGAPQVGGRGGAE